MNKIILSFFLSVLLSTTQAEEMDHSKMNHDQMDHSKMEQAHDMHDKQSVPSALTKLEIMPASGNAREGGSDGRYVMEFTSVFDTLEAQCAKASRALIMLDNASWARCGGKPQGAAMTPIALVGKAAKDAPNKEGAKAGGDVHEHSGHHMP